ncbi:deoxyuridine 5'-triphosphate nucleotidohydrolase [Ixodes scapularis]|uniref:deoxyuridine 5'-triphosphate nucleotidohydrolase n=1 Tax=Ixodes scapularis TaxID=6945 RepID=UPI001A9D39FE|nr:deoxyuridine 5'-triphosphate nucleotidohydrolase [Ixodes scapularis]
MATLVSCAIGRLFTTSRVEQAGSVPKLAGIGPVTQVNFQGIQTVSKMPGQVASLTLKFAKLSKNAYAPTKGSPSAAGFDLYSAYDYNVPSRGKCVCLTDIQIAVPDGCYGRVAPRSGLAAKHFIDVGAGVIDQDYRGNVGVVLFNFGDTDFKVSKGDRIAQLVCEKIAYPTLEEAETLDSTERGDGGFGSTGTQ